MSILLFREGIGKIFFLFSVKTKTINILDFVGDMVSIATIHLCHGSMKAAVNQMSVPEPQ